MNQAARLIRCLGLFFAMASALAVLNIEAGESSSPSRAASQPGARPVIVLNGITTIFGDKRALFNVVDAPTKTSRSYFLSEGERSGDIELLSVDARAGSIRVSDQGVVQWVTIRQAPVLGMLSNPVPANATAAADLASKNGSDTNSVALAPNPVNGSPDNSASPVAAQVAVPGAGFVPGNGTASGGSSSDNVSSPANPGNGSSPASAGSDNTASTSGSTGGSPNDSWWMKEAQKIEQARQETAQRVMDGKWQPYPLTPLTPPGTPSQLISSASAYFFFNPLN